jgi:hypothetical protein
MGQNALHATPEPSGIQAHFHVFHALAAESSINKPNYANAQQIYSGTATIALNVSYQSTLTTPSNSA